MENQKLETGVDFLQCLVIGVSMHILSFLDDPADLVRASAVSRFWHQFVLTSGIAKQLCLKRFPQISNVVTIQIPSEEMEIRVDDDKFNKRAHHVLASLLQAITRSKIPPKDCIVNAICASSTDHYPEESVANTLNSSDRFIRRGSYWSSKGQIDPEFSETLIYKLGAGIWTVTEVDVQPLEAFFQMGKPIYSSKYVRFRVGYPKSEMDFGSETNQLPLQNPADDEFAWYYTSPEFPMVQKNRLQPFKLPEEVVCIGGYVQIELTGALQRQQRDGLFYIRVCHVRVMGRPLSPAFDVETLEPHGKFLVKYHPKNLDSILKTPSSDVVLYLRQLVKGMESKRMRMLEDLLGEIRRAPNFPYNWNNWVEVDDDDDEPPVIRLLAS